MRPHPHAIEERTHLDDDASKAAVRKSCSIFEIWARDSHLIFGGYSIVRSGDSILARVWPTPKSGREFNIVSQVSSSLKRSSKRFGLSPSLRHFPECSGVSGTHSSTRSKISRFQSPFSGVQCNHQAHAGRLSSSDIRDFVADKMAGCSRHMDIRVHLPPNTPALNSTFGVLRFPEAVPIFGGDTRSGRDTRNWKKTMDRTLTT